MINLEDIKDQTAYLTLGTVTHVYEIFKGRRVNYKHFIRPSTKEIREHFAQHDIISELFGMETEVVIIVPSTLEGTGLIKPVTKTGKQGDRTKDNDKRLPTDQFFRVPSGTYCFIICADIDGKVSKEAKAAAKKIEGGVFQILDLQPKK